MIRTISQFSITVKYKQKRITVELLVFRLQKKKKRKWVHDFQRQYIYERIKSHKLVNLTQQFSGAFCTNPTVLNISPVTPLLTSIDALHEPLWGFQIDFQSIKGTCVVPCSS